MATSPLALELDIGAVPLLLPAPGKAVRSLVKIPRMGAFVAATTRPRHQQLLDLLQSLVSQGCPSYLRHEQDDIVQDVAIDLHRKLGEMEQQLTQCLAQLKAGEEPNLRTVTELLRTCLNELETFGDRNALGHIKRRIKRCYLSIGRGAGQRRRNIAGERLGKCLAQLKESDGKDIFAGYYVRQRVHWAIMDAIKKCRRRPEVSLEGGEEGELVLPANPSGERAFIIRMAIDDCLAQLDESKALPTHLALQGHAVPEIARLLDLGISQTESRVRRGREFLHECLIAKGLKP